MNLAKKILIVIIFIATMFSLPISSLSVYYDNPELDINIYPSVEAKRYYDSLNIQTDSDSINVDNINDSIISFAVSENGYLAIGLDNSKILILDEHQLPISIIDFDLQYTDHYGLDFHGENICIFFINTMVEIDLNGNLVSVSEVLITSTSSVFFQSRQGRERPTVKMGETIYRIENDSKIVDVLSGGKFSRLVSVGGNNEESIIYDSGNTLFLQTIASVALFIALVATVVIIILLKCRKKTTDKTKNSFISSTATSG